MSFAPMCYSCWSSDCEHTRPRYARAVVKEAYENSEQLVADLSQTERIALALEPGPAHPNSAPFKEELPAVADLLDERGKTHGNYETTARIAEEFRDLFITSPNWQRMTAVQRDALLMLSVKLARMCSGDHRCLDHAKDAAGYLMLLHKYLAEAK